MRILGFLSKIVITPPSTSSSASSSSSLRAFSVLINSVPRPFHLTTNLQTSYHFRQFSSTPLSKMSFSNTQVPGDKPADPYKATNLTNPDLKEKIQDLVSFIESCKFGMMTTRIESSGLLVSRCMALAAKVGPTLYHSCHLQEPGANRLPYYRKEAVLTSFSTRIPSPVKPTTSSLIIKSISLSLTVLVHGQASPAKPTLSLTVRQFANTTPPR